MAAIRRVSEDQADWHAALEKLGYRVAALRTLGEFCLTVAKYLEWKQK